MLHRASQDWTLRTFALPAVTLALALASAAASAGCSGAATAEPAQTASSAATRAPLAVRGHGVVGAIAEAMAEVPLRADQRAEVERLTTEAEARHAPARAARAEVVTELAAQVERGQVDAAALAPKIDAAAAAHEKTRADDQKALDRLHALLDAGQRDALVHALRARGHERAARAMFERAAEWRQDLALTDAQVAKIRQAFHDEMRLAREEHRHGGARDEHGPAPEHDDHGADGPPARHGRGGPPFGHPKGKHALDAFARDDFRAEAFAPPAGAAEERARAFAAHVVRVVGAVLPELTAEQRLRAAQKLRARADDLLPAD